MSELQKILGVIGDPISHSLSPRLHGFLMNRFGLAGCYHAFRVEAGSLEQAVRGAQALGFLGLNVTLPHKQRIIAFLDEIDEEAQRIGAVNTVIFRGGRIFGSNTDAVGFLRSLAAEGIALKGREVFVLGAGGAARAVCHAAVSAGARSLSIWNRTRERAEQLAQQFGGIVAPREKAGSLLAGSVVVNATRVGMRPAVEECPLPEPLFREHCTYVDLVYNPLRTHFLQQAERCGAATVDGLGMLIFQAVKSLELWFQQEFEVSPFYEELRDDLHKALG